MTSPIASQPNSRVPTALTSPHSTLVGRNTPPSHTPGIAFTQAITKFRARLKGQDLVNFKNTTFDELCKEILKLQREQERRGTVMNLSRIQSFLEAMNQFGKVIEIFLNVSEAVAFIWGPMKFLLLTASTYTDSFEKLLEAYEQIGEELPLLVHYESLFHNCPQMVYALELMWKNFDSKFSGILKSMSRHKSFVEANATIVQYRLYQADTADTTRKFDETLAQHRLYQADIADMKQKLDETLANEHEKKLRAVKEWLAVGSQPQIEHDRYRQIRKHHASTAQWILQNGVIKHWRESDVPKSPILWMHGIPGAGKTVLASAIIDDCARRADFFTCYFYCHYDDPSTSSAVGILRGLIDQLLDHHPDMLAPCYTRRSTSGEPSLRSLSQARRLLEDFCSVIPKLFIVIDGLDECEKAERSQAIDVLMGLIGKCDATEPGKLRVLVVSQNYGDIRKRLQNSATTRIVPDILEISNTDNEGDIRAYTKVCVKLIAKDFDFTHDMSEYLENLTVERAKGNSILIK
ncbi:C2H2 domain-containing protein [Stemphylium lycopersici]|nr:C2H2 domain-containing protein [Stemphylium lycopersici]